MKKSKFSIAHKDEKMINLVKKTDKKTLAIWALDCAKRVLTYFEKEFPKDLRPRLALETLKTWIKIGEFHMAVIRKASLDSHAAARDVGENGPPRSAARACGQAVATAHVKTHAYGCVVYAQQAVFRINNSLEEAEKERDWQYRHLIDLLKKLK